MGRSEYICLNRRCPGRVTVVSAQEDDGLVGRARLQATDADLCAERIERAQLRWESRLGAAR